jgi:hypothetical protein
MKIPDLSTEKQTASGEPLPVFQDLVWFTRVNLEGVMNMSLQQVGCNSSSLPLE